MPAFATSRSIGPAASSIRSTSSRLETSPTTAVAADLRRDRLDLIARAAGHRHVPAGACELAGDAGADAAAASGDECSRRHSGPPCSSGRAVTVSAGARARGGSGAGTVLRAAGSRRRSRTRCRSSRRRPTRPSTGWITTPPVLPIRESNDSTVARCCGRDHPVQVRLPDRHHGGEDEAPEHDGTSASAKLVVRPRPISSRTLATVPAISAVVRRRNRPRIRGAR